MKDLKNYIFEASIPNNIKELIKYGMKKGYIMDANDPKRIKYGCSRENIGELTDSVLSSEDLNKLIKNLESDGYTFKYEKDSEFEKDGYENPKDY